MTWRGRGMWRRMEGARWWFGRSVLLLLLLCSTPRGAAGGSEAPAGGAPYWGGSGTAVLDEDRDTSRVPVCPLVPYTAHCLQSHHFVGLSEMIVARLDCGLQIGCAAVFIIIGFIQKRWSVNRFYGSILYVKTSTCCRDPICVLRQFLQ